MQVDKENIVKGRVDVSSGSVIKLSVGPLDLAVIGTAYTRGAQDKAHAQLFADALEVFNKTNLTPSELLEQRESKEADSFIKGQWYISEDASRTFEFNGEYAAEGYLCGKGYAEGKFYPENLDGWQDSDIRPATSEEVQERTGMRTVELNTAPVLMDQEQRFEAVVAARLEAIWEMILVKGREYRRNGDVFHNFNAGGKMIGCTPERALLGFATKHFVSIVDLVNDLDAGKVPAIGAVNEKLGDAMVYLVLLEGLFKERINNVE